MKQLSFKRLAGILPAAVLVCASMLFASCDYWNEDWYKNGESTTSNSSTSGSGSSDSSGTTAAVTVTVSGASGTDTLYLSSGTMSCLGAVTGDVISVTVTAGGSAVSSGITYQWQRNADADAWLYDQSSPWVDISGATGASYTVTQDTSTRYDYRCKVTKDGSDYYPENSQIVRVQIAP